jgi:hypothetical protein
VLTLADFGCGFSLAVTVASLIAFAVATVVLAVTDILHLAVAVGAPGTVAVTALVVALAAVVLAWGEGFALTAGGGATAARRAVTATATLAALTALGTLTTGAVAARVEAPRCGGGCSCPLHLIC